MRGRVPFRADRRTGRKPSRRWEKANAVRNTVHHRVANLREDALHKITTSIAAEYGTVVVEDLNAAVMLRNRRLVRRIADEGFGVPPSAGSPVSPASRARLVVADRWYPSSKPCFGCKAVKAELRPHVRIFHCDVCGLLLGRDVNAARNLAALAAACVTGTGVAGDQDSTMAVPKPRGADHKTRATRGRSFHRCHGARCSATLRPWTLTARRARHPVTG